MTGCKDNSPVTPEENSQKIKNQNVDLSRNLPLSGKRHTNIKAAQESIRKRQALIDSLNKNPVRKDASVKEKTFSTTNELVSYLKSVKIDAVEIAKQLSQNSTEGEMRVSSTGQGQSYAGYLTQDGTTWLAGSWAYWGEPSNEIPYTSVIDPNKYSIFERLPFQYGATSLSLRITPRPSLYPPFFSISFPPVSFVFTSCFLETLLFQINTLGFYDYAGTIGYNVPGVSIARSRTFLAGEARLEYLRTTGESYFNNVINGGAAIEEWSMVTKAYPTGQPVF